MINGLYGFNIAVNDLPAATQRFESVLGVKGEPMEGDDFAFPGLLGTRIEFDGLFVHLITSKDPNTSISKFLESRGEGVFLVSLKTSNIDDTIATLQGQGIQPLLDPPHEGDVGRATFVHPKDVHGVQLEIIQPA